MKIVLLENLRKLGTIGQIIDVKRGYARNFLFLKKKLYLHQKKILKKFKKLKLDLNKKDQEKKNC